MNRGLWLCLCLALLTLSACGSNRIAEFWRPISEPNLLMPLEQGQKKLDFDLSQCRCGIYPTNIERADIIQFQPDNERMAETGIVIIPNEDGQCMARPSLEVTECMRQRGWEVTNCSGRMPLPGGGSLCSGYVPPEQ
jgi:hypothetical protein